MNELYLWTRPKSCQEYNKQFLRTGNSRDLWKKRLPCFPSDSICHCLALAPPIVRCYLGLEERSFSFPRKIKDAYFTLLGLMADLF